MRTDAIVFAGLMPHAPILVPGVGKEHLAQVRRTVWGMAKVAAHVVAAHPATVVVISPHSPRRAGAFGLWQGPRIRGSLGQFGDADDTIDLPVDRDFAAALESEAGRRGLHTWRISGYALDHGAFVPLSYLTAAGWKGPTVVASLPEPEGAGLEKFGHAITAAALSLQRRTAVIASGDMSHRLAPDAPAGYDPAGNEFDHAFITLLRRGAVADLSHLDTALQEAAAEDVVASTRIAVATTGNAIKGHDVLSYERPFGVGYGVAILFEPGGPGEMAPAADAAPTVVSREADLPRVARCAVTASLEGRPANAPFQAAGELVAQHGLFVTVRTADQTLRGCHGSAIPGGHDLVWSTWHHAIAAASQDARFPPVRIEELPDLRFTVTILGPLERVNSPAELDPAMYGILVSTGEGRSALLLPGIQGIDTAAQQLAAVREKGGIRHDERIDIRRFGARRIEECFPPPESGHETGNVPH